MSGESTQQQKSERSPGRPRSTQVHEAIIQSALQLLVELGYERMSIEAVAAHAGVGKTTIYRRWNSKEELVVDALASVKPRQEVPDSGNVREDILLWVEAFVKGAQAPFERQMLALLIGTFSNNPPLAERYWSKYATPIYETLTEVLKRGQARGEILPDIDLNVLLDVLSGTVFYQLFMKPPSETLLDDFKRALDLVFHSVGMVGGNKPA